MPDRRSYGTFAILVLAGVTVAGAAAAHASLPVAGELRVGWASADITPEQPVALAGQMWTRISKGVRDPITCTALAVETVKNGASIDQAVMVSCDLVCVTPQLVDELAAAVAGSSACPGLDPAKIIVNATHTHTAPFPSSEDYGSPAGSIPAFDYRRFAVGRMASAVKEAWTSRAAGSVSWALAHAAIARNRRVSYFDTTTGLPAPGRTQMYGATDVADFDAIEGPAETGMPLVFFWNPAGQLTGVIVNLACPAQETAELEEVSADFWHETRAELRRLLGPDVFVLPQCAAAAGSTSWNVWRKPAEEEMLRRRGLTAREDIARRIAAAVADVLPYAKVGAEDEPVLAHVATTLDLPQRLVTPEERDRCRAEAAAVPANRPAKAGWHLRTVKRFAAQQAKLARGEQPVVPVSVHAVRLGDVAVVTNSFELFEDYGIRIQARSPALLTCVVQLAGRGTMGTYLPTARAVEGGGYSATVQSNLVGPEGGRMLVDESVALLQSLWSSRD